MFIFQPPPYSRYDLNFNLAGFPVRVHPLFWLMTILIGFSINPLQLLIWVVVVFVSILVHELGHALAMRRYGQPSQIVLHAMGGLTIPSEVRWGSGWANVSLTSNQEIFIALAGSGAGFILAAVIIAISLAIGGSLSLTMLFGLIPFPLVTLPFNNFLANSIVMTFLWVTIFWGLINLMPVYPLDGGNVARRLLIHADPWGGARKSLWVSVITGAILTIFCLVFIQSMFMTLMFGLLAVQSYMTLQGRSGIGF